MLCPLDHAGMLLHQFFVGVAGSGVAAGLEVVTAGTATPPVSSTYRVCSILRHSSYWSSAVPVSLKVLPSTSITCGATSAWNDVASSRIPSALSLASLRFLRPLSMLAVLPTAATLRTAPSMRWQL